MPLKTKLTKIYNLLLRLAIILATYGFIYRQVFHHQRLDELLSELQVVIRSGQGTGLMLVVLLLMPVNWGIEAAKWRWMIARIEQLHWISSVKAIFTGISVSLFTPNRTGEYLGRVFVLRSAKQVEGVLITIAGSISQMLVTLVMGLCGIAFALVTGLHGITIREDILYPVILATAPVMFLILLLIYFNLATTTSFLQKLIPEKWPKFRSHTGVLSRYSRGELMLIWVLSLLRYFVFSAQFFFLLKLFGVPVPYFEALMLIALVYLVMLVIPSIALLEVGIRGSVSLLVFQAYLGPAEHGIGVLSASVMLWLINIVIPAIIGTFFVHHLNFFRK